MLNVITDKVEHCKQFGIDIEETQWPCHELPLKLVTDQGSEYRGMNSSQITELGVELVNLQSYRAELKGPVEKAFDALQGYMRPHLKGKGWIEVDFHERGAHDYRKDACLTLNQFEQILLNCILFYNSNRVIENFRMTEEMIDDEVKPIPCNIWSGASENLGHNLIPINKEQLIKTLLPRTTARFTRKGLSVNGVHYTNMLYRESFLDGKECEVAFDLDDVSYIYLLENSSYIRFEIIESRFRDKALEEVQSLKAKQRTIVKNERKQKTQAEIELARSIRIIADRADNGKNYQLKI